MYFFRLIIHSLVLAIAFINRSYESATVSKSLRQVETECKQYLPSGENCLRRCELLLLRSWNDTTGSLIPPSLGQYFVPDCDDLDYVNRTRKCIADGTARIPEDDVCARASIGWNCYQDQYGQAVVVTPRYIPMPCTNIFNTFLQCSQMLQIDEREMEFYERNRYDVSLRARCLFRCALIKMGLYSDSNGLDIDRLYVQCGGYGLDLNTYRERGRRCVEQVRSKCYDNCTGAARLVNDCFPESFELGLVRTARVAKGQDQDGTAAAAANVDANVDLSKLSLRELEKELKRMGITMKEYIDGL